MQFSLRECWDLQGSGWEHSLQYLWSSCPMSGGYHRCQQLWNTERSWTSGGLVLYCLDFFLKCLCTPFSSVCSFAGRWVDGMPQRSSTFCSTSAFSPGNASFHSFWITSLSATNGGAFVGILCWMCPDSSLVFGGTLGAADCTEASCGLSGWVSLCFGHFSTSFFNWWGTLNL